MTDELWRSAAALAAALRATPAVERMCRPLRSGLGLPPVNFRGSDGFNPLLVIYHQYMRTHPLLGGVRLTAYEIERLPQPPEGRAWIDDATMVGETFQTMIELLRARLPGYPMLRVPHLRPGSPRLIDQPVEFTGFPWDSELRRSGLHLRNPPSFDQLEGDHLACREQLLATGSALERRPAWERFAAARSALSVADEQALTELGKRFAAAMSRDNISAVIRGGSGRFEYREAVLHELVGTADGAVAEYLVAFEAVDELITVIACFVQTLVLHGELTVEQPYRLDVEPGADLRPIELAVRGYIPAYGPTDVFYVRGPVPQLSGIVYPLKVTEPEFIPPEYRREDDDWDPDTVVVVVNGKLASGSA